MSRTEKSILALVFAGLLFAGWRALPDFGTTCDEVAQHRLATRTIRLITEDHPSLLRQKQLHHGPFFTLVLYGLEKIWKPSDVSEMFRMRHAATHAFFLFSGWVFYLIARRYFGSAAPAFAALLFFMISPRIYVHSFFNPKDIPFLSLFVLQSWALIRLMDRPALQNAVIFGALSAAAASVRLFGFLPLAFAAVYFFAGALRARGAGRSGWAPAARVLAAAFLSFGILLPLCWPALLHDPAAMLAGALRKMTSYPLSMPLLFEGQWFLPRTLPARYLPVWIGISTPLSILALCAAGLAFSIFASRRAEASEKRVTAYLVFWLIFPLAAAVAARPSLYNSWRHFYFLYPAIALFAAAGLRSALAALGGYGRKGFGFFGRSAAIVILILTAWDLGNTLSFTVRNHPHSYVYFNAIAGGIKGARNRFELDYWSLSHKRAIEYILRNDKRRQIRIALEHCGYASVYILPPAQRNRVRLVSLSEESDYLLETDRMLTVRRKNERPWHSIVVDGVPVCVIRKLRGKSEA